MSVESSPPPRPDPPTNEETAEATGTSTSATIQVQTSSSVLLGTTTSKPPAQSPCTSATTSSARDLNTVAPCSTNIVQETSLVAAANKDSFVPLHLSPPASTKPVPRLVAHLVNAAQRSWARPLTTTAATPSSSLEVAVEMQSRPFRKRTNEDSSDGQVSKWQLLDQESEPSSDGTIFSGVDQLLLLPPSEPEEMIDAPPSPEGSAVDYFVPSLPPDIDNW